uniref:Uncharacterized protein n=1 Tax=Amphilophus citrinellus TaxID=61819 RepID=A0A3Q0RKL0_AMPCI
MAILKDATFDAVLQDPMAMCGDLVAEVLGVPLILSLRFSIGSVMERHCGHAPSPPSYVPLTPLPYSDRMTFTERLINMVTLRNQSNQTQTFILKSYSLFLVWTGSASSVCETLGKADVWLIRTFWDIETPRPIPPNFKYVGGLHCKPANQLPEVYKTLRWFVYL